MLKYFKLKIVVLKIIYKNVKNKLLIIWKIMGFFLYCIIIYMYYVIILSEV